MVDPLEHCDLDPKLDAGNVAVSRAILEFYWSSLAKVFLMCLHWQITGYQRRQDLHIID